MAVEREAGGGVGVQAIDDVEVPFVAHSLKRKVGDRT